MKRWVAVALTVPLLVALAPAHGRAAGATRIVRSAPAAATIDPALSTVLASLAPGETTTVVVTLRTSPDLASARRSVPIERPRAVIRTLRTTSRDSQSSLRSLLRSWRTNGRVTRITPLWIVDAMSITATADAIRALATRPDIARISLDRVAVVPTAAPLAPNLTAIHADGGWSRGGTGAGIVVANLDSGVDVSHPALSSRWRGGSNSWFDPYGQHPTTPTDMSGHGTATMGVMVGGDEGGTSIGVAPGAQWIAAKIFNDSGSATTTAIHQAFQWVLDPDHDPATDDAPDVVNNSWSIGTGPGCNLAFQADLQALRAAGILPVVAAGNYGPAGSTSVSPANYPEAFSVGAVDNAGGPYAYSSRGPSTCGGRSRPFPDLVAPGVNVLSADRFGLYQSSTGTSMAAPHVAGALALLLDARPDLTVDQQADVLRTGAADLGAAGPDDVYGAGMLDVAASFDALPSPVADTEPPMVVVTPPTPPAGQGGYVRGGQTPVTVSVTASDPAGVASIVCTDGAVALTPAPAPAGNPLTATSAVSIDGDGSHTVSCAATDALGNGPGAASGSVPADQVWIDTAAPWIATASASPNPTNTTASDAVTFSASLTSSDATSGVAAAEWFEGTDPGAGMGAAMLASDGAFGGLQEGAGATIDVGALGWPAGPRTLWVRARDAAGNWERDGPGAGDDRARERRVRRRLRVGHPRRVVGVGRHAREALRDQWRRDRYLQNRRVDVGRHVRLRRSTRVRLATSSITRSSRSTRTAT